MYNQPTEEAASQFIESEISKRLKEASILVKATKKELKDTKDAFTEKSEQLDDSLETLSELAQKEQLAREEKDFLKNQLIKMRSKEAQSLENKPVKQTEIPFDKTEADFKLNKAKTVAKRIIEEKREKYLDEQYKAWKYKPVIWFSVILGLLLTSVAYLISKHGWSPDDTFVYYKAIYDKHPSYVVLGGIVMLILTVVDVFIFKEIQKRWHDPRTIDAYRKLVKIPKEMRDEYIDEQLS